MSEQILPERNNYLIYEGCPESIRPFGISRELVAWPWCNLATTQRRAYCDIRE